jgi:deoxyribonuclease-2
VGVQLSYTFPGYYDSSFPSWASSAYPTLQAAATGNHTTDHSIHTEPLQGVAGTKFMSFAKTKYWGADLYESGVAPFYNADVLVESWMNGINPLDTCCTGTKTCPCPDGASCAAKYNAINIRSLNWGSSSFAWLETQDHSKWAITQGSTHAVCIGDINRQNGQLKRGGGTVCQQNTALWKAFSAAVDTKDSC